MDIAETLGHSRNTKHLSENGLFHEYARECERVPIDLSLITKVSYFAGECYHNKVTMNNEIHKKPSRKGKI